MALRWTTDSTFTADVLEQKTKPVLVLFTSPGCNACSAVRQQVRRTAEKYRHDMWIMTCDISRNPELGIAYAQRGTPTVVLFHRGKEVWRRTGGSTRVKMMSRSIDGLLTETAA